MTNFLSERVAEAGWQQMFDAAGQSALYSVSGRGDDAVEVDVILRREKGFLDVKDEREVLVRCDILTARTHQVPGIQEQKSTFIVDDVSYRVMKIRGQAAGVITVEVEKAIKTSARGTSRREF